MGRAEEQASPGIDFVYGDLVARLAHDTANSWQILGVSGVLLGILSVLHDGAGSPLQGTLMAAAIGSLMVAILAAYVSVMRPSELERFVPRLRGLLREPHGAVFHTRHLVQEVGFEGASLEHYLVDLDARLDAHKAGYCVLLAHIIEFRKMPRTVALASFALGTLALGLLLLASL